MKRIFALLLSTLVCSTAMAEFEELRSNLLRAVPALVIESIETSPIEGLYSVSLSDGSMLQATKDGKFFVYGDLYRIDGDSLVNQSEFKRNSKRRQILEGLKEEDMVVFAPLEGEVKATLTVFTDVDCGYCRRLHQEVPELNRMGIAVRYLAYPRMGIHEPHTPSYNKLVSAWCADNRKLALTQAKAGQAIEEKFCENPVDQQFAMGEAMGVTGTPAILYEDGRLSAGYKPAAQFAQILGIEVN
ncbi:MAG: DsbC family protein [Proteobacteria bacterium]|jgi:thiol:disulfide interchange protein DsbC|nr:DsbC family protein [Pseudomonadota bacterium]MDA1300626.1 DsbC family protein [Pseudomonadota bacterium]